MNDWPHLKLADITTKVGSGATPRGGKASYKEAGIPLIRSMNVHTDGFRYEGLAFVDDSQARALDAVEVRANDVLLNITGASIGRVTVAPARLDGARVNQHVCIIRPTRELAPNFLRWFLASPDQQGMIMDVQSGATRQALTREKILSLEVPVPPLTTQERIVAEIEKHFSRLDEAVANFKRIQANLKRYRASVLKAACEGRLVPTEAELARREGRSYETGAQLLARILKERRTKWEADQLTKVRAAGDSSGDEKWKTRYQEPPRADTTGLSDLPDGWVWATAEQLSDETRPITYGVIKLGAPIADGVPTLRSSDVRNLHLSLRGVKRISPAIAANYKRTFLEGGEILITVRGTLGGVVIAPSACAGWNISREVAMLALIDGSVGQASAIFIASPPVQNWLLRNTKGIAYIGLNIETLKLTPIPLASLAEQRRIVAEAERRLSVIDEVEGRVQLGLKRAERLRQAILKRAFEGKLVRQDPNDEPASALLEWIRMAKSEKQATAPQPGPRKRPGKSR